MNRSIIQAVFAILGMCIALFVVMAVFTKAGNSIGQMFVYLTPAAFLVSCIKPRFGMYTLVIAGVYMDTIKRLMILDYSVSSINIAAIQAFCPALVSGIIVYTGLKWIRGGNSFGKLEFRVFSVAQFVAAVVGVGYLATSGINTTGFGNVVNSAIYISFIGCIPKLFEKPEECVSFFKFIILAYIPAALWCIKQAFFGIADFEMEYLMSGLTNESRQLNERVFRNMGTLASAPAMSYISSILAAAMLIPFSLKHQKIQFSLLFHPMRLLLFALFAVSAYYTYTRTGWLVGGIAVIAFFTVRSRLITYLAIAASVCSLMALIIFAQNILDARTLNDFQAEMFEDVSESAEMDQVMVVGTVNGRLESLANLKGNSDLWTPFGLAVDSKIKDKERPEIYVHDAFSELLAMVGYIPFFSILIVFPILGNKFYSRLLKLPPSKEKSAAIYFFCLGLAMMLVALGQLKAMFVYPVNMFWALLLGFGIVCFLKALRNLNENGHLDHRDNVIV